MFLNIYKLFVRPPLDYGHVKYDQAYNESFKNRLESIQQKSALTISDTIKGTFSNKLYQKLGIESLATRLGIES